MVGIQQQRLLGVKATLKVIQHLAPFNAPAEMGQVHAFKRVRWRRDFSKVSDYVRVRVVGRKTLDLLGKRPRWWRQCSDQTSGHEDISPSHPPKPSMALMSNTDKEKRS